MSLWGIQWRDSEGGHLIMAGEPCSSTRFVFTSKKAANAYIRERYGYIATRKDLRSPPHNWRMPKAVRVVIVEEATK